MATTNTSKNTPSNRLLSSIASGSSSPTWSSANASMAPKTVAPTPVAVGPRPTPNLPSPKPGVLGVSATAQYPGGAMFSTPNPPSYTETPQGKEVQKQINQSVISPPKSPGVSSPVSTPADPSADWIKENYEKYAGWNDPAAIKADFLAGNAGAPKGSRTETGEPEYVPPSDDEILGKYKEKTGVDLDQMNLDKIKSNLSPGVDLNALLAEIEAGERGAAEEEYRANMGLLASQKEELGKTAEYQKGKIGKQLEADIADVGDSRTRDVASIEKQRTDFDTSYEKNKDVIGANWRALSLRTQALSRARGITNSDFASYNESKQAMDLNKGLRELATNAQSVLGDFMTALKDTNDYYAKAESKLRNDAQSRTDDIDEWLRSSVVAIQQEEGKALGQKLADIKSAASRAAQLKLGIAQQAETRRQNLEDWLLQTKVNFDNSLKLAAQGKVQSAADTIKAAQARINLIKTGLQTGILAYEPASDGKDQVGVIHGNIPGIGEFAQTTPYSAYEDYRNNLNKMSPLEQLQQSIFGSLNPNQNEDDLS